MKKSNASCDGREAQLEVASRTSRHGVTIGCGRVDAEYLSYGGGAHPSETWGAAIEPTAYAQLWTDLETLSKQLEGTCKLDDPENDRQSVSLQIPSLKVDFTCEPDAVPEDLGRLIDRVEGAVDEMPPGTREAAQQARAAAASERLFAAARQRATDIANGAASVLTGGSVQPLRITVDGDEIRPHDPKAQGFDRDLRGAHFTCEEEVCTATTASATYTLHFGFDDDGGLDIELQQLRVVHKP